MTAKQVQIRRDTGANLALATPASGELAFNTTAKRLSIGDGATAAGILIPNFSDIQQGTFNFLTAGGTADVITLTPAPALGGYTTANFTFKATANNTGAATINISGLGAKNIKKMSSGALANLEADDIVSGGVYQIFYDGTQFQIKGLAESNAAASGWELLAVASGGGSSYDFTSVITSDYDDYALVLSGMVPDSNSPCYLRTSSNNGSSYDSGSTDYDYAGRGRNGSGTDLSTNSTGAAQIQIVGGNLQNHSNGFGGTIMLYDLNNSSIYKHVHGNIAYQAQGVGHILSSFVFSAARLSNSSINALSIFMSGGNWVSGTAKLYGIKSSL